MSKNLLHETCSKADMYQLLSLLFQFPTEETATGIKEGTIVEDIATIFSEIGIDAEQDDSSVYDGFELAEAKSMQEILSNLRREYTLLFSHPDNPIVPIYETVFLHDPEEHGARYQMYVSPIATDVGRCYKEAGVTSSGSINEPVDHIATELEFMAYLEKLKAQAMVDERKEALIGISRSIKEFKEEHFLKWAPDFFLRCAEADECCIYRTIGKVGVIFLKKVSCMP